MRDLAPLLALALASPAAGKGEAPLPRNPAAVRPLDPGLFRVTEHELPNGLKVRLLTDRAVPTVSYYTFFRVGSRNERPGITGLAHFFEHMMFNGAKKYGPKEFDRVLESAGGTSNAYTSSDVTAYYEDFASDALPTVVELERLTVLGFVEIVAAITIVLPLVLGGYVLLADRARAVFRSERAIRRINRTTGAAMACAAVAVATR